MILRMMKNLEKNINKMTETLKLVNICKNFGQKNQKIIALENINLTLKKGDICGLIGPSGSGKTTLLQIAGLLDLASSGEVFVNGIDISKADDKARTQIRRQNIGFIYQFHHLLPEFSALENVAMPLFIRGCNKDEALDEAKKILTLVDLQDRIDHKPSQLSGGQQQRTAIARAIIGNPSLILADEPTGNLDSQNSQNIFDLLNNLAKERNISCLIVTHNLDLVKKLPKYFEIKDGKLL
jgi:lipoprotein-releasing system ATP-binding protein